MHRLAARSVRQWELVGNRVGNIDHLGDVVEGISMDVGGWVCTAGVADLPGEG